jgi:hypothetical protein
MDRNPAQALTIQPEDVRFQLSLLHLLYPTTASSKQLNELELLLHLPANLTPAR